MALLIVVAHLGAFLILDRLLRRSVGETERRLFAIVFWLGPSRLLYSAFVWNANLLPVFGAIHLASSFAMRRQQHLSVSLVHVLALGICTQIHVSAAMLAFLSIVLVVTRTVRFHWGGAAFGAALVGSSLVPWVKEVVDNPQLLPFGKGFLFHGLLYVSPLVRSLLLWVRYPSLLVFPRMQRYDFTLSPASRPMRCSHRSPRRWPGW